MRIYFSLLLVVACNLLVSAQDREPLDFKFGVLSEEELAITDAPDGIVADAYVLFDQMKISVEQEYGSYYFWEKYTRRVKLLRPASFDLADIQIVYRSGTSERPTDLAATIFQPNGEKSKLPASAFKTEKLDDNFSAVKFTYPDVSEGAVIEFTYVKRSQGIVLPRRYAYHEKYPVRYAEFRFTHPDFLKYVDIGNLEDCDVRAEKTSMANYLSKKKNKKTKLITSIYGNYDLLPVREEIFSNSSFDRLPHALFQLRKASIPKFPIRNVMPTWKAAMNDFYTQTPLYNSLNTKSFYKKAWSRVKKDVGKLNTEREKMQYLYDFVAENVEVGKRTSAIPTLRPNATIALGKGSTADKTLLFMALMNAAGIPTTPVLVRTRDSGIPIEDTPVLAQFDLLIAQATIDGEKMLLDPNTVNRPPGLPRLGVNNHRIFIADRFNPEWVDYKAGVAEELITAEMTIDSDGSAEVDMSAKLTSYIAFNARSREEDMEKDEQFPIISKMARDYPTMKVMSKGFKDAPNELNLDMKIKVPVGEQIDDFLYVSPIIFKAITTELDETDERKYPLDFPYPWLDKYSVKINPPAGYTIDELPESGAMASADGSISCSLKVEQKDGVVQLDYEFSMNEALFAPEKYNEVRKLWAQAIEWQESTVVFKKAK